jgi:hypothetical protein
MLMLCWFYCLPLAKFIYFSFAPLLFFFSLFVLKRGIRNNRQGLRQTAFFLMFIALVKTSMFDIRVFKRDILCANPGLKLCDGMHFLLFEALGVFLLLFGSWILFHFYRKFLYTRRAVVVTPEQLHLRFWSNTALASVIIMAIWQLAPWVGYLTVGYVPRIFTVVPWSLMSLVSLGLLLNGFWRAEGCNWQFDATLKKKNVYVDRSWTPRDTLWMGTFIYLITLALSYAGHDVLAGSVISQP